MSTDLNQQQVPPLQQEVVRQPAPQAFDGVEEPIDSQDSQWEIGDDGDNDDDFGDIGFDQAPPSQPIQQPQVNPYIAQVGQRLGLSPDQFRDQAAFENAVLAIGQRLSQSLQPQQQVPGMPLSPLPGMPPSGLGQVPGMVPSPPFQPQQPPQAGLPQQPVSQEEFRLEIDERLMDPMLVKNLRGMEQHFKTKVSSLEQQLSQAMGFVQQQQLQQQEQQLDQLFASTQLEQVLGKGKSRELSSVSPELANRVRVIEQMNVIEAGYRAYGLEAPPIDYVFQQAVQSVFGNQIQNQTRAQIAQQAQRRQQQFSTPPTSRSSVSRPENREDYARQRAAERLRQYRSNRQEG